jgi:hypothetical protein
VLKLCLHQCKNNAYDRANRALTKEPSSAYDIDKMILMIMLRQWL